MQSLSKPQRSLLQNGHFRKAILLLCCAACDRPADRAANDTGTPSDSLGIDTSAPAPVFRDWTLAAGRHLLVSVGPPDTALVVFPEFTLDTTLTNADFTLGPEALVPYELFAADGVSSSGRLTRVIGAPRPGCDAWPLAYVSPLGEALRPWNVGLRAGIARGVPYNSLAALQGRDSSALVIDLSRLASQAPNDTAAALRGLPYVVRSAYQAFLADSQRFVFAELVRRVNVEASPYEERVTVIAERAMHEQPTPYSLLFSERYIGEEERVPTTELIGLLRRVADGIHMAFAVRDFSDGGTYLMYERSANGRWRLRWQSAYAGC